MKYLDWMQHKGLIVVEETITITPKGLETYKTLVEWIKETVGDEHLEAERRISRSMGPTAAPVSMTTARAAHTRRGGTSPGVGLV